jgi:DNA-binding NtrC family response regulator
VDLCQALSRPNVLCIGSDACARDVLAQTLREYELVFVDTAFDAIRSMNAGAFDAYVTNFWLADWAGPQLCRAIRDVDPHCPVIVYSVSLGDANRGRASRAGASAFVVDGEPELLPTTLRALLARCDAKSVAAKPLLEDAVMVELARYARTEEGREIASSFVERTARSHARKAFIEAGGSCAHFERWWPQVFGSARASHSVTCVAHA